MNDSKNHENRQDPPTVPLPHPAPTLAAAQAAVEGEREGDGQRPALPCLYSNNCTDTPAQDQRKEQILALCGVLSPYQKRQAHTLFANVERLIQLAPSVGHVGFFTLTTPDNVTDKAEFSRRWHSMRTHYWSKGPHFGEWIGTFEQQIRGAWHLHILVILAENIREGVNFEEFAKGKYRSASPYLRSLWADLRASCALYGFGRHELLPVKSNAEGMARYMGKYISKHIGQRDESAKGKRLVSSSRGWVKNSVRFAWHTEGAQEWRRKFRIFAHLVGCYDLNDLYARLGPGWAYRYLDSINDADILLETANSRVPF